MAARRGTASLWKNKPVARRKNRLLLIIRSEADDRGHEPMDEYVPLVSLPLQGS